MSDVNTLGAEGAVQYDPETLAAAVRTVAANTGSLDEARHTLRVLGLLPSAGDNSGTGGRGRCSSCDVRIYNRDHAVPTEDARVHGGRGMCSVCYRADLRAERAEADE